VILWQIDYQAIFPALNLWDSRFLSFRLKNFLDKYLAGKIRSSAFLEPIDGLSSFISLKSITSWLRFCLFSNIYENFFKMSVKSQKK
jgi:hypothetical protein